MLSDISPNNIILGKYVSLDKGNKNKNKQMGLHQIKKLLHTEGNYQQNEKSVYWMGADII